MSNVVANIENMNKRTKMILSVVGVCAVIVPAILLWYLSSHSKLAPQINNDKRSVNVSDVQSSAKKALVPASYTPATKSTPSASSSAVTGQGTSSAR